VRRLAPLLIAASLTAAVLAPVAATADRMWIGFHDDPMLRFESTRQTEMDAARSASGARIVRTLVTWATVSPTRPANAADPFDPAYKFDDLDELVRNAQVRGMEVLITLWGTPKWANGDKTPNVLPTNVADFGTFARAVASRYSGRYGGLPFVRFFGIWNESNLNQFLSPQFDAQGNIVSARAYATLAAAGYAGIKAGNAKAQVAIGETSARGRSKKVAGQSDTVAPGKFAELVAKANKRLKFDAWAHHPYPAPVSMKPTQKVKWPNVSLSSLGQFGPSLDTWFGRKNVPIWITEYGQETKPGEPGGVSESTQAVYIPQAIAIAAKDPRVQMFVWFVLRDSAGSPWQSGLYRPDGAPKPGQVTFARAAKSLDATNGKLTVKAGTRNPLVTLFVREFCENNPAGTPVGTTSRTYLGSKLVQVDQVQVPLGIDCTATLRLAGLTVAKGKTYTAKVQANTLNSGILERTLTIVAR